MKKGKILRLTLIGILISFLTVPLILFGQSDTLVIDPTIPIPDGLADLLDYNNWFLDVAAVGGLTVFLSGLLLTFVFKGASKRWRQGTAIILAVILSVGSAVLNFGYLAEAPLINAAVYGIGSGFLANGFYNQPEVKAFLKWLRIKPPSIDPA